MPTTTPSADRHRLEAIWPSEVLRDGFCAVPNFFLRNYHRLKVTPTEAMLLVHVFSYRWDRRAPFPSVPTLARQMGLSPTQVRRHLRSLEDKELIVRDRVSGGPSKLRVGALIARLVRLEAEDAAAADRDAADDWDTYLRDAEPLEGLGPAVDNIAR